MKRDREVTEALVEQDWIVLRFWEHTIRKKWKNVSMTFKKQLM